MSKRDPPDVVGVMAETNPGNSHPHGTSPPPGKPDGHTDTAIEEDDLITEPSPHPGLLDPVGTRRLFFLLLVAGVTYWFFDLIAAFLMPVFWAIVLAIVFAPMENWFARRWPDRENLTASLTTIAITLVVIVPVGLVILAVVNQAQGLIGQVQSGELDPTGAIDFVERQMPLARAYADDYGVDFEAARERVLDFVNQGGQYLGNAALNFGQNFLGLAVDFFLMLYFLWWMIRDGENIIERIVLALPLGDHDERLLLGRFATVSRATLKGTLIVAVTQGTLGGLLFWGLGIDGALFWGVIMTLLSLLPVGGSAIVWVPAAVIMAAQGIWWKAIVIVAFGALAIGLVDNLLRPLLVGRDTKMPDYLVLIATLGGIAAFGLAGFVIGPVVAALFLTVWEMMTREAVEEQMGELDASDMEGPAAVREIVSAAAATLRRLGSRGGRTSAAGEPRTDAGRAAP